MAKQTKLQKAIEIIALNDEPLCLDVKEVACQISVVTIADVFEIKVEVLANRIIDYRIQNLSVKQLHDARS